MDFGEFAKGVQNPKPVYYLKTDQDYLKRKVLELARSQVGEGAQAFDWAVLDLERDSEQEVVNTARTLPWMSPYRWIYVHNADQAGDELRGYLNNPIGRTVLILELNRSVSGWPRFDFIEMPAALDTVKWLRSHAEEAGVRLPPQAARALVELVGEDLQRLAQELEKLVLTCRQDGVIDESTVRTVVLQSREVDVFALIGALASRDSEQALRILARLLEEGVAPPQIVSMLYWNFRRLLVARERLGRGEPLAAIVKDLKIWSYRSREREIRLLAPARLADILIKIRETDRWCKTSSADERMALERLIVDTCLNSSL